MNNLHDHQCGRALDDLNTMLRNTPNERDKACITALIGAVQARQRQFGFALDSTYTPGFARVLKWERERRQQQREVSA